MRPSLCAAAALELWWVSEYEFHRELDLAREISLILTNIGFGDRSEVGVIQIAIEFLPRHEEGIGEIEKLRPELNAHLLVDAGCLVDGHIELWSGMQPQTGNVGRRHSRRIQRRWHI